MYLVSLQGQGTSCSPWVSGIPTECTQGTNSPSSPSASSAFGAHPGHDPHRGRDVGGVGQLDADLGDRRADRAHREGDDVHGAALHRAAEEVGEERRASPPGACQLLVGPASSSCSEQMKVRSSTRATSSGRSGPGRSWGASRRRASRRCRRRRAPARGGRTPPPIRRTSGSTPAGSAPPSRRPTRSAWRAWSAPRWRRLSHSRDCFNSLVALRWTLPSRGADVFTPSGLRGPYLLPESGLFPATTEKTRAGADRAVVARTCISPRRSCRSSFPLFRPPGCPPVGELPTPGRTSIGAQHRDASVVHPLP